MNKEKLLDKLYDILHDSWGKQAGTPPRVRVFHHKSRKGISLEFEDGEKYELILRKITTKKAELPKGDIEITDEMEEDVEELRRAH